MTETGKRPDARAPMALRTITQCQDRSNERTDITRSDIPPSVGRLLAPGGAPRAADPATNKPLPRDDTRRTIAVGPHFCGPTCVNRGRRFRTLRGAFVAPLSAGVHTITVRDSLTGFGTAEARSIITVVKGH